MPFYQASLIGSFRGQAIVNVLWFRDDGITGIADAFFDYMSALGAEIKDKVWNHGTVAGVGAYSLRDVQNADYTLERIDLRGWDTDLSAFSSDAIEVPVGQFGVGGSALNGGAPTFIMHYNLAPALGPGVGLPTRGHIKVGPVGDDQIDDDGKMVDTWVPLYASLGERLAMMLATSDPVGHFLPVRVRVTRVLGVITALTYKDVTSVVSQPIASFLRSRRVEA